MASLEEERRLNALTFDGLPHTHIMESFSIELQDFPRPQLDLETGKTYHVQTFFIRNLLQQEATFSKGLRPTDLHLKLFENKSGAPKLSRASHLWCLLYLRYLEIISNAELKWLTFSAQAVTVSSWYSSNTVTNAATSERGGSRARRGRRQHVLQQTVPMGTPLLPPVNTGLFEDTTGCMSALS